MMQPVRVLIIDDHPHAREGMREILRMDSIFEVVGEGTDGLEAIRLTEQTIPELILMDITMPKVDGFAATKEIKARFPHVKIVIVTISDEITNLFEALKKGAQGVLLKNLQPEAWIDYLKAVVFDEAPVSKTLSELMIGEFAAHDSTMEQAIPLTAREKQILLWVAQGVGNREIADQLNISEYTVKNHLKNMLHKLHLNNRVQLAAYAYEHGFMKPSHFHES
jgi:DNA-binding NarL/FixJ family response regulator